MGLEVWTKTIDHSELGELADLQGKWKRFLDVSPASQGMFFGMGQLEPGETAGWHEHPEPELFFVLEGSAVARWRDGEKTYERRIQPGQAFFKEGGVPHQMDNDGEAVFRGLFFKLTQL